MNMARIVNDDSSESRQSVQYKSKTYQSYDNEIQDMTRYYDDTFNDHDELTIQSHFQNDEGGVPETVVDDLGELKKAAQVTLNARKPIIDWKTRSVLTPTPGISLWRCSSRSIWSASSTPGTSSGKSPESPPMVCRWNQALGSSTS